MNEAVTATNTPQENARCGVIEERLRFPGKDAGAPEPKAQGEVLKEALQPHFLTSAFYREVAGSAAP